MDARIENLTGLEIAKFLQEYLHSITQAGNKISERMGKFCSVGRGTPNQLDSQHGEIKAKRTASLHLR